MAKADVKQRDQSGIFMMPQGLLTPLTPDSGVVKFLVEGQPLSEK